MGATRTDDAAKDLSIRFTDREAVETASMKLFGRKLSPAEMASLAGAENGSNVWITSERKGRIEISWNHGGVDAYRIVTKNHIHNASFSVSASGHGKGAAGRMMSRQIAIARKIGVKKITTEAARSSPGLIARGLSKNPMVGYKVWPKFGYNAKIPSSVKRRLPQELRSAKTVQDLYKTQKGRDAWAEHGKSTYMTLDLTAGSQSMRVFNAYRKSKGK